MSSASILSEIYIVEGQIAQCEREIAEKKMVLQNNTSLKTEFEQYRTKSENEMQRMQSKSKVVSSISSRSVFATKYADNSHELLFGSQYTNNELRSDDALNSLNLSLNKTENQISQLNDKKISLDSHLASLRSQYQAALQAEAAAAAGNK